MNSSLFSGEEDELQLFARKAIKDRCTERKAITLPWFHRVLKEEVKTMTATGWSLMKTGRVVKYGIAWAYKYLLLNGMISRKRTCKRAFSEEEIRNRMSKWLHCCREVISKKKKMNLLLRHPFWVT